MQCNLELFANCGSKIDFFFTGKNRARTHFIVSIDLFFPALSNDTHIDMHFKKPGTLRCGAMWKQSPTVAQKDIFVLVIFFQYYEG